METMKRHWPGSGFSSNYMGSQLSQRTHNTGLANAVGSINPLSPKLAASAFKIGQTYSMLGDYYRARLTFDEVLDHYPGGAEANLSRKAIEGLTHKVDSKPLHAVKTVNNTP